MPTPPAPEPGAFRDWANLPELPLAEVLRGLLPCLRSLYAFATTCRSWRRLLRASAADLVLPRLLPLLLVCPSSRLVPFSPLVLPQPQPLHYRVPVPADATLLSASRGYLILLRRGPFYDLHLLDALTGAERRALQLPSPHYAYHYAAFAPSRPRASSSSTPTTGLPDATTFDRWRFGPHLVVAGDRLLLVLFMLRSKLDPVLRVKKVAVFGLDMAQARWEEVDDIGAYSLFVDCAERSAVACVDAGNCGVEENRVYVAAPGAGCHTWRAFPPGWEAPLGGAVDGPLSGGAMNPLPWPSQIWVYPRLFFC